MSLVHPSPAVQGRPARRIREFVPEQGNMSEEAYLDMPGGRLVEFCDGVAEVLPMPNEEHQDVVLFLVRALLAFVEPRKLGKVQFAPLPVEIRAGKYREPDVLFMFADHSDRRQGDHWVGADLVMEVVSEGVENRTRDHYKKRADYAQAGIPEYWIVDPNTRTITVFKLKGKKYSVHGRFGRGRKATSSLLPGFAVDVKAVFERK
jgi:Uma2 family endonuclease